MQLDQIQKRLQEFAREREWDQFHDLKSLALAMVGEVGEICELLQWESSESMEKFLANGGRDKLAAEVSDVLFYLLRIADKGGVHLESAINRKFEENHLKYPVEKSKGVATKYTEFRT